MAIVSSQIKPLSKQLAEQIILYTDGSRRRTLLPNPVTFIKTILTTKVKISTPYVAEIPQHPDFPIEDYAFNMWRDALAPNPPHILANRVFPHEEIDAINFWEYTDKEADEVIEKLSKLFKTSVPKVILDAEDIELNNEIDDDKLNE